MSKRNSSGASNALAQKGSAKPFVRSDEGGVPHWKRPFFHLLSLEALMQFGLYLQNPIVSSYAVTLGASVALAGFVTSLNAVTSIVIRPVTGFVSDLLNKKSLLVFSCIMFVCASVGLVFAPNAVVVGFCRVLQGVGFAFKSAIVVSLVALVVPKSEVGSGIGSLGMAFTVACALGPLTSNTIADQFGYPYSFMLACMLFSIALMLCVLFKAPPAAKGRRAYESNDSKTSFAQALREAFKPRNMFFLPALSITLVVCFTQIAQGMNMTNILLVGKLNAVGGISLYYLVYAAVSFFTKPLGGCISDRYGCAVVVVPGALMAASAMLLLAFSFSFPTAMAAGALMGLGHGSLFATMQSESVRKAQGDEVGRAANMFYIGSDFGMGMGPMLGGFFIDHVGCTGAYLFSMGSVLCGLLVFLVMWRRGKFAR